MADSQQTAAHELSDSNAERNPQPAVQEHVLQLPPSLVNTTPWRHFLAFLLLASIDLALNVCAGVAATQVGAQLNHKAVTARILRLGAQAGAIKSAITTFREVVLMTKVNIVFRMLMLLTFSSFGICLVLVAQVCNQVLDETPKEFLIAALVASIPLFFEAWRTLEPQPEQNDDGTEDCDPYFLPILSIGLVGSNALGGYVFARMASNQGMPISNYHAACSAGAVFGTLTFLARGITGIIAFTNRPLSGKTTTIFGVYEWIWPEPIILTEEEWNAQNRLMEKGFDWLENGPRPLLRLGAKLLWFVPMDRKKKRDWRSRLMNKATKQRTGESEREFREMMSEAGRHMEIMEILNRDRASVSS